MFLRRASFASISAFTSKPYPNSHMGRGLQLVTAEAHSAKWCFATSHLESPMWSECVPPSSQSVASVRSLLDLLWACCRYQYVFHREREIQVEQARSMSQSGQMMHRRQRVA